jgi:hypothetical protein
MSKCLLTPGLASLTTDFRERILGLLSGSDAKRCSYR